MEELGCHSVLSDENGKVLALLAQGRMLKTQKTQKTKLTI